MLDASNYLRTAFFLGPIDVYGPGHRVSCERLAFVMAAQTTVVRKTSINGVTLSLSTHCSIWVSSSFLCAGMLSARKIPILKIEKCFCLDCGCCLSECLYGCCFVQSRLLKHVSL